jgi:hypothetical protein
MIVNLSIEKSSKRARNVSKVDKDDDEEWLAALEAGELNERGGIMKHPAMTTARQVEVFTILKIMCVWKSIMCPQRAMMGSDPQQQLLELPTGDGAIDITCILAVSVILFTLGRTPNREMTEEMQARKNELARKRRQREAKKREEQKVP